MNDKVVKDDFALDNQKNSRVRGKYDQIAKRVEAEKCVFCDLRQKYIVFNGDSLVLTVNIFPYINGQLLIVPKRHVISYFDLYKKELDEANGLIKKGMRLLTENLAIGDFWIILRDGVNSGKTVKHLHWNIIPYTDDLNTWHYQEITIPPVELAEKLRKSKKIKK